MPKISYYGHNFSDEILDGEPNPFYVFDYFICEVLGLDFSHLTLERLQSDKLVGAPQEMFLCEFTLRFPLGTVFEYLNLQKILWKIRKFFTQACRAASFTHSSLDYYVTRSVDVTFRLSPDFAWENLTKGIAPGDIIGFCTPEEEAALEPHLYDIELCVME